MSHEDHRRLARDTPVACAVVTVSDTRTEETDGSGDLIRERLATAGHPVVASAIVPDEPERVREVLERLVGGDAEAILVNGGTGISQRDRTFEVVSALLEKTLPGFGEIFRSLSFAEIGPPAMLSRATAGVYRGRVLFSMPGSPNAVRLAVDRLIVPELRHIVWELVRHGPRT